MPTTYRDICTDAAKELGVIGGHNGVLNANDAADLLGKLHRVLNNWNADRRAVYATAFLRFTLVPNLSPHTIGPTGATWTVTQRPVSLESAALVLTTSSPEVYQNITLRDAQWWAAQTIPSVSTTIPTDLYYQPDWPNGSLYFWPVPTAAYDVELQARVLLDDTVTLDTTFSLPPGYQDGITMTLAEESITLFGVPADIAADVRQRARQSRTRIFANNDVTPLLTTQDGQNVAGSRSSWNYLTGQVM